MNVEEALQRLLGRAATGDSEADLWAALEEAWRRRRENIENGGAVIAALRDAGVSEREISRRTGIPRTTLQRWHTAPGTPGGEGDPAEG